MAGNPINTDTYWHWMIRGLGGGIRFLEYLETNGTPGIERDALDLHNLGLRLIRLSAVLRGEKPPPVPPTAHYL